MLLTVGWLEPLTHLGCRPADAHQSGADRMSGERLFALRSLLPSPGAGDAPPQSPRTQEELVLEEEVEQPSHMAAEEAVELLAARELLRIVHSAEVRVVDHRVTAKPNAYAVVDIFGRVEDAFIQRADESNHVHGKEPTRRYGVVHLGWL